jgi:hypothetical protein
LRPASSPRIHTARRSTSTRARPGLVAAASAAVAFTVALAAYGLWPEGESAPVAWSGLTAEAGSLTITRETKRVFRERIPLAKYLTAAGGRVPAVDFERRQVLLVSPGPRSSTGYSMEVLEVRERDGSLTVTVRERTPELGGGVEPRVTFPYRLLSLPAGPDVYVDWRGR